MPDIAGLTLTWDSDGDIIREPDMRHVAHVLGPADHSCTLEDDVQRGDEQFAYCRLFAASPRMLATLKKARTCLSTREASMTDPLDRETLEEVNKAIAEAEGQ